MKKLINSALNFDNLNTAADRARTQRLNDLMDYQEELEEQTYKKSMAGYNRQAIFSKCKELETVFRNGIADINADILKVPDKVAGLDRADYESNLWEYLSKQFVDIRKSWGLNWENGDKISLRAYWKNSAGAICVIVSAPWVVEPEPFCIVSLSSQPQIDAYKVNTQSLCEVVYGLFERGKNSDDIVNDVYNYASNLVDEILEGISEAVESAIEDYLEYADVKLG